MSDRTADDDTASAGDDGTAFGDDDATASAGDDATASAGGDSDRPRVLVDAMCGKLATYLRMCGYDAAYALDRGIEADDRLLSVAAAEDRTVITRDRQLAARADDAVLLTDRDTLDQLREVDAAGYPVDLADEPTRCGACNGPVERVDAGVDDVDRPEYVPDDVGRPPDTGINDADAGSDADTRSDADAGSDADTRSDADAGNDPDAGDAGDAAAPAVDSRPAWRCLDCGQWFWKGSHWDDVAERLDEV